MNRIICIGNRLVPEDGAGLAVHDKLQTIELPHNVILVEGGLAGLGLLPHLEAGGRVVFVDAVSGFTECGKIIVLEKEELLEQISFTGYGHHGGLPYLLNILPFVCEGTLPEEIVLVGLEGDCSDAVIDEASALSFELATRGYRHYKAGESYAK